MLEVEVLKKSLARNTKMWMAMWVLVIVNIFAFTTISKGFSIGVLILFLIIGGLGIMALRWLAARPFGYKNVSEDIILQVGELMDKIRPFCDDIFENEINRITEPVLATITEDFNKGLSWLWENGEDYLRSVEQGVAETRAVINMTDSVSGSKIKIAKKLKEKLELMLQIIDDIGESRHGDREELERHLYAKAQELKQGMSKEKEIFYDYVEKLLIQQIKTTEDSIEIIDYFNIDKLGEQFSVVIEKSIQGRLSYFKDSLIKDLEYMSADIVGKMQKGALQLRNIFNDINELITNLIEDYRNEDALTTRRLKDSQNRIIELKEQANDFLVTLAWQDILIEKRWQDIQVKLYTVKDLVLQNVSQEVTQYIIGLLEETVPNLAVLAVRPDTGLIYKACLDAETIYQVSESDNMREIIGNDVFSLLQFIRPLELMVGVAIRFEEIGISDRRIIKDQLRQPEYLQIWDNVKQAVNEQRPELLTYLEELYPLGFASFCNSPYIRKKPENVNDAAWMLFMGAAGGQDIGREGLLLIGLLLVMHRMRNNYIHPLKSQPLPVERVEEVEYMRFCAYKSIEILVSLNLDGIVKNKLN